MRRGALFFVCWKGKKGGGQVDPCYPFGSDFEISCLKRRGGRPDPKDPVW